MTTLTPFHQQLKATRTRSQELEHDLKVRGGELYATKLMQYLDTRLAIYTKKALKTNCDLSRGRCEAIQELIDALTPSNS